MILVIQPSAADTYMTDGIPTQDNSGLNTVYSGRNAAYYFRSLFFFDLSGIPSGALITAALLELYQTFRLGDHLGAPKTYSIFNLSRTDCTDLANWNTYNGMDNWTTPGGDFHASPKASHFVNNNTINIWRSWDVLANVLAWWASGAIAHFLLKQDPETLSLANLGWASKEYGAPTLRPKLTIDYEYAGRRRRMEAALC